MLKVNPTVVTLGIAGILAIAVGFYVNSVSWGPVAEQKTTQATATTEPGSATKNAAATPAIKPTWAASATGRVEPKSGEVRITAEVPGRIIDVAADLNDRVKAGDLLVRLDDDDALTKVAGANAEAQVRVTDSDPRDRAGRGRGRFVVRRGTDRDPFDAVGGGRRRVVQRRNVRVTDNDPRDRAGRGRGW